MHVYITHRYLSHAFVAAHKPGSLSFQPCTGRHAVDMIKLTVQVFNTANEPSRLLRSGLDGSSLNSSTNCRPSVVQDKLTLTLY